MNRHDAALSGLATSTATSTEAPLAGYLLQRSESLDSVVAAETGSGGSLAALTATMNASDSAAAGQVAATDEGLNIGLNDQSLSQTLADDQTQLTYVTTIAGDELNYVQALAPVAVNFQVASAEAEIVSAENGGDGGGDSPDSPAAVYAASALAAITGPVTQAADDNWNALNTAAEDNSTFASAATSALQQATTSETGSLAADLSADDAAGLSAIQADASAAAAAIEGVAPTSVWSAGESSIVAAVNSTVGLDVSQATGSLQKEVASLESDGASGVRGLAALLAGSTAASADLMSAASAAQATSLGALTDSDATPWTPTLLSPPALPGLTGETYPGGEFGGDFGKLKFVNDGYYTSFLAPMDANLSGQSGDPDAGEYVDDFTSGGESLSNDYDSNPYDANDTDTNSNDMIVDMRFDSFDAYGAWGFGVAQAQNDFANIQQPFYSSVSLPTPSIANPPASASTAAYSDGVTTQSIDGYRDSLFTQTGPTGFWMTSGADSVAPSLDSSSDSSDSANVPSDLDVGDFALSAVTPTDSPISTANDWSGLDTAAQTQAGPTVETTLDAFATSVASGTSGSADSSDSTDTAAGGELDDFNFQNPNQAAAHLQASSLAPTNPFSEFGATGAANNGVSATYTTNSLGQLTEEQDPNGQTIDYTYNSAGQVLTETDVDSDDSANATETENVYNAAGQLASQSQVSGGQTRTTSYDYNAAGSVTQETDPDGKVTVFTYGAANQVTSETWYPSADAEAVGLTDATDQFIYTYNAAGELTSATDDQSSYTFTYDGYGRLLTVDNAGTPGAPPVVETYAYDPGNNSPSAQPISLTATDGDGHEYFENLYTYDASGDETSVTQIVPGETDKSALFKYNSPGQLAEVDRYMGDLPTGAIDSDDSGEFEVPTTATPALVAKSVYGYTDGNLTSIDNTNNNSDPALQTIDDFSWAYVQGPGIPDSDSAEPLSNNGDSLPLANAATIPGGSSLPAWEVSSFTSSVDGKASYNYDADAQLTGTIYTGPTPGENYTGSPSDESYFYDDAGNRTNVDGTATVVGPFNEVTNDGTYCYVYDADGDLIRETSIATGDYTVFQYDNRDRMTSATLYTVTSPSSTDGVESKNITYTYDVFNNMIARTETDYTLGVPGTPTTQEFVYAGPQSNGQIALTFQTTGATAPTMSNVTDRYLWGPAVDQILADDRTGSVAEDAILWTIDDNQNTVRDVVDSSGTPLDHITYSAYGVPLSPPAGTNAAAFGTIFGYTGAYTDPTTGLQNRVDRVYDPLTGAFTTPDPAQADTNAKRYAGNDPTNEVDRNGLDEIKPYKLDNGDVILIYVGGGRELFLGRASPDGSVIRAVGNEVYYNTTRAQLDGALSWWWPAAVDWDTWFANPDNATKHGPSTPAIGVPGAPAPQVLGAANHTAAGMLWDANLFEHEANLGMAQLHQHVMIPKMDAGRQQAHGQATATEHTVNAAITILFLAIPGPEDVVVAVAAEIGFKLVAQGGKWAIFKGGQLLTGDAEKAAAQAIKQAAEARAAAVARSGLGANPLQTISGQIVSVVRRAAGFADSGVPLIIDSNSMRAGIAEALRARGFNVRTVTEIFGPDPGDPAIRALAEKLGGKVLTNNMTDFGRNIAIKIDPRASTVDTWVRLIEEGLR